jgi:hypothetical protein
VTAGTGEDQHAPGLVALDLVQIALPGAFFHPREAELFIVVLGELDLRPHAARRLHGVLLAIDPLGFAELRRMVDAHGLDRILGAYRP